jgi:hypothetical protein
MKKNLKNITLMGIDCVSVERLQKALDISSQEIDFGKVKLLTSLPSEDPRRVEIPAINSLDVFSEFCIRDLYKYVDTDFVLLVQHDGFIINPQSWEDKFLDYDYIGAPWLVADWSLEKFDFPKEWFGKFVVGNGGFCLRSRKFIETSSRLYSEGVFKKYHPEDVALCVWYRDIMEAAGIKFAPPEVAARFSLEGNEFVYDKQFGFHGLRWRFISKLISEHPEWDIKQVPSLSSK